MTSPGAGGRHAVHVAQVPQIAIQKARAGQPRQYMLDVWTVITLFGAASLIPERHCEPTFRSVKKFARRSQTSPEKFQSVSSQNTTGPDRIRSFHATTTQFRRVCSGCGLT